ncbi:MAG: TIGR02302 family protein [Alphaproteobacteria bacterium]|nr:TIGR02302 family protein [Alphaproteobacteria bacterium]
MAAGTGGNDAEGNRMSANESGRGARPAGGVARKLGLARLALLWEQLWPALWPAAAVIGVFLVIALFDLLPLLPGAAHTAILAAFIAALAFALWQARRAWRWPDGGAAEHRIETASGLADRPLVALRDGLAAGGGDQFSEGLWRVHRARMRERIAALRVGAPRPGLARHDPWALRAALLLVLIVAVVAAGADGPDHLARAAQPDFSAARYNEVVSLELWVTPPVHTGKAPLFLDQGAATEAPLSIPVTSNVVARLHGKGQTPALEFGDGVVPFSPLDAESFQAEATITGDGRLAVRRGGIDLVGWDLKVIPDQPPIVVFALPPGASQRAHLSVAYFARDDYGVAAVRSTIRRVDGEGNIIEDEAPIELDLGLVDLGRAEVEATAYHDLTPHPWAGLEVSITLEAEDAIDQIGRSEPILANLPARVFQHPVARAIVDERRKLSVDGRAENRRNVAYALRDLSSRPKQFFDDKVVFLALVTASARLVLSDDDSAIPAIQQLLWDTALRIEDGEVSLAERDLRAAQQALMEALESGATDAELDQLIDALRSALDRYLQALAENMADDPQGMTQEMPFDPNSTVLEFEDLRDLLEQARELARSGARDAAKDLLAQFQDILENMQPMMQQQSQAGEGQLGEMLRDLSDLIRQQQDLLDDTHRNWQQGGRDQSGMEGRESQQGAASQEQLRRDLGDLMRRFGERYGQIPDELGKAEGSMRRAEDALKRALPGRAIRPQGEALDSMREGGRVMARGQQGMAQGATGEGNGFQRDPFGRPMPGFGRPDTENVDIPEIGEIQRARQILDELRRRAGERGRPQDELDYIDRLLRRF